MRNEKRIREIGEVFTPPELVNKILDKISQDIWLDSEKTWLDPTCGNGNFLVEIKDRLLKNGHFIENVLSRIYGVDIMQDNIDECKDRLDPDKKYRHIVDNNIVCADALRYHFRFDGSHPYDQEEIFNRLFEEKDKIMTKQRKIIDARADKDGDITHVLLEGNTNFTSVKTAIPMAERGELKNTHVVHPTDGRKAHLRTNADSIKRNNLDNMAGDK